MPLRLAETLQTRELNWLVLATLLLGLSLVAGCEIDTRVKVSKENPPKFTFSGNGMLAQFFVSGPYTWDELKLSGSEKVLTPAEMAKLKQVIGEGRTLWQLHPEGDNEIVSRLPAIGYGVIPKGFRQVYPKDGTPLPLLEGKYYVVSGPTHGAGFHTTYFLIQNGKAVEVSIK
jgi:hypothetical protein